MKVFILAVLGALAAILANRGIAVFNDGLRPILPEFLEGRMNRKALAATSFAMSFGLVVGFGIPISIAATIILIHSVLLATDIIGTWCPDGMKGTVLAGIFGGLWGGGIAVGLEFIVDLCKLLPVNFLSSLRLVGAPVVAVFCAFPALTVAYQYGFKKGGLTFLVTFLVRQLVQYHGTFRLESANIALNPEGMALLIGMILMIFYATRKRGGENDTSNTTLVALFSERVKRIRSNVLLLAVMGGLVAAAVSLTIIAGDPISLQLIAEGKLTEAALTVVARGLGFIPLVATTAIATGVYSPIGMTFIFALGIVLTGKPVLAFVAGGACILAEVFLLDVLARAMDKFPGMRACADNIRTAMTKILEVALFVGGMLAANNIAPEFGFLVVTGLYILNQTAKKPLVSMAVGPIGAIIVGLLVNILYALELYFPPMIK